MHALPYPARLLTLASAALLGLGTLTAMPYASAKSSTLTLHYYEVGVGATLLTAAGKPIAGGLGSKPKPGEMIDEIANLYAGSHVKHGSKPVGTDHLLCTFTKSLDTVCEAQAAIGGSLIIATSRGGTQDDFPVTEATGKFLGMVGISHHHPVTDQNSDLTIVLHKS